MTQHSLGFVYVLTNEAMPGMVKIGRSARLAEDRANELFTTGLPCIFDVYFRCLTSHAAELEKRVHKALESHRVASNREFFRISPEVAAGSILKMRAETDGIAAWSNPQTVPLRSGDRLVLSLRADQVFMLFSYPGMADFLAVSPKPVDVWQAHGDGDTLEVYCSKNPAYAAGISVNDAVAVEDPVPCLDRKQVAQNDAIIGRERLIPGDRLLWMDDTDGGDECSSVVFEAMDYFQVVARTTQPQLLPGGVPLLINFLMREQLSPGMIHAAQAVMRMPPPRSWAPHTDRGRAWGELGRQSAPPEYWLPQLERPRRAREGKGRKKRKR